MRSEPDHTCVSHCSVEPAWMGMCCVPFASWRIALTDKSRQLNVYMRDARDGIKIVLAQVRHVCW